MLRPAVKTSLLSLSIDLEPELGGDRHLVTERTQSFAHKLLVRVCPIYFSGIEECNAAFDCRPDQRDSRLLIHSWAQAKAQSHAAKPNGRHFQIALSKFAFLHDFSFQNGPS